MAFVVSKCLVKEYEHLSCEKQGAFSTHIQWKQLKNIFFFANFIMISCISVAVSPGINAVFANWAACVFASLRLSPGLLNNPVTTRHVFPQTSSYLYLLL